MGVARRFHLAQGLLPIGPHLLGDLRQVALTPVRKQALRLARLGDRRRGGLSLRARSHRFPEGRVEPVHPGIVPLTGDGREDRDLRIGTIEFAVVPPPLLAHVPQRVGGPPAIGLVQDDRVGQIQHVDLLELGGSAVLGRHHVDRCIGQVHDLRVALSDPGGLDQDQVEVRGLEHRHGVSNRLGQGQVGLAGGERAHVDARPVDRVHADPVCQQGASRAPAGGIDQQEPTERSG